MGGTFLTRLGQRSVHGATHTAGTGLLLTRAIARLGALRIVPVRAVLWRQIYFSGVQVVDTVAVLAAVTGLIIVVQTTVAGAGSQWLGRILVWTVVREVGPLLAAIVVVARSGPAVATELASMRLRGEIDALWVMGIDPLAYLVVPRLVGLTVGLLALTVWFQGVAVAGGLALGAITMGDPSLLTAFSAIVTELGLADIGQVFAKGLLFGGAVAASACYHGYRDHTSPTEIPQAGIAAVMQGLLAIFLIDGVVALGVLR